MKINLALLGIFVCLPFALQAIKIDHDRGQGQGDGAIVIRDDDGKVIQVITPAKNPRAIEAQNTNKKGKSGLAADAAPQCAQPTALSIKDIESAADTIASTNGMLVFKANGPLIGQPYAILGIQLLAYSQTVSLDGYWDWNTDPNNLPLMISPVAALVGNGSMVIQAGETLTITFDGGQTKTITFPVALEIPQYNSMTFFVDSSGRLFNDALLTAPLDGKTCP